MHLSLGHRNVLYRRRQLNDPKLTLRLVEEGSTEFWEHMKSAPQEFMELRRPSAQIINKNLWSCWH